MAARQKIIFDCDNTMGLPTKEVDDGLTLLYLLGRPDLELLGVTTTFGNGTIDQVFNQTEKLLDCLGLNDLPVFRGAGERGSGPTEAAGFLAEIASAHSGEVVVLATGPLGNLRGARALDKDFYSHLSGIACMGGYLQPVRMGRRDVSELNLSADPEAAREVLGAPCPTTLFTAQICLQAPFGWKDLRKLSFWGPKVRRPVRQWLILHAVFTGLSHFYLWDLLPAVYISHPELFQEFQVKINSSLQDLKKGTLLPEESSEPDALNMPTLIKDQDRLMEILFNAWQQIAI